MNPPVSVPSVEDPTARVELPAAELSQNARTVLARRYLSTPEEFVTMRLFGGSTPEEISRGNANPETFGVQADAQIEVSPRVLVLPQISAIRDELPGGGDYRMRYSIGFGGMLRF